MIYLMKNRKKINELNDKTQIIQYKESIILKVLKKVKLFFSK